MANLSGQTLNDRILAAKHSLAGQGLAKAVCKATTEELIGPKRKHLDYLLHCTEEPNVSIPTLANLLIERAHGQNWIVVFKSLVTIHHMMCYGNERFVQYLASSNTSFQLSDFQDKSGVHGGYEMSPYVRRYAKYLTEKSVSYRTVAFDFCKVKRGKDGGTLRQMSAEKLLKTLPVLQNQLDSLLDFDITAGDLNNGIINSAFMLLFRDLIRLFACYNDGIINLLEKYFDMNKKLARDALDLYKKFLIRMDRVAEFLKVAENVGVDKGEIPDLAKAPSSLLEALESRLANLEGRKVGSPAAATTPTSSGGASGQINEKLAQQLLAEEEQAMAKYKEQQKATNPFLAASSDPKESENTPNILDLFGMPDPQQKNGSQRASSSSQQLPAEQQAKKGANTTADLLQMGGNPFAQNSSSLASSQNFFESSQAAASGPGANFFGDILQPKGSSAGGGDDLFSSATFGAGTGAVVGTPFNGNGAGGATAAGGKVLVSGDLDASLANLTSSLNLAAGSGKRSPGFGQVKGPPMAVAGANSKNVGNSSFGFTNGNSISNSISNSNLFVQQQQPFYQPHHLQQQQQQQQMSFQRQPMVSSNSSNGFANMDDFFK